MGSPREGARAASPSKMQVQQSRTASLAFKTWARGRCYRCLARDHQVSSCRDHFRCIRCRRPGHRERQCRLWSPSAAPRLCSPTAQPRHSKHSRSWVEVVAIPPSGGHGALLSEVDTNVSHMQGHHSSSPSLGPVGTNDNNHGCRGCCKPSNLQSQLVPLMESLRSDLKHLIEVRLEEVMRPVREDVSTIKLWLARIANHLECGQSRVDHSSVCDVTELFGPCSPIRHSSTSPILASLAAACMPTDCLLHNNTCEEIVDSVVNKLTTEVDIKVFGTEFHQKIPMEQGIEVTTGTSSVQMADQTSIEDVVLVEDASDDEMPDKQEIDKDPIFLITIEDCATYSAVEMSTEEPKMTDEDPPTKAMSPPATAPSMDDDLACPSMHPTSPLSTRTRRRRKSYDRSSLRRSARLAQRGVLKDLGIIRNDGKLNEDVVQIYAEHLKNLLPSDLLKQLMELKGRAFWDMVTEVSLTFL